MIAGRGRIVSHSETKYNRTNAAFIHGPLNTKIQHPGGENCVDKTQVVNNR